MDTSDTASIISTTDLELYQQMLNVDSLGLSSQNVEEAIDFVRQKKIELPTVTEFGSDGNDEEDADIAVDEDGDLEILTEEDDEEGQVEEDEGKGR